jgi:uncharacterized protein (TIGR03435 family)
MPCRLVRLSLCGVALSLIAVVAWAQGPTFEVASVKPSRDPWTLGGAGPASGGRWLSRNATLLQIIHVAFDLRPGFVVGGPSWIRKDRFQINAKADGQPSPAETRLMVQSLLADRFKLKTHTERRPVDLYALVKARADGRLGPGLRPSTVDCKALLDGLGVRMAPQTDAAPSARPPCTSNRGQGLDGMTRLSETWPLENLVRFIQGWMDRAIIDRTDLQGYYDMDLAFAPPNRDSPDAVGGAAASVFTAFQEQLGLKLEARREMMDVLIVDSAEMPDPD